MIGNTTFSDMMKAQGYDLGPKCFGTMILSSVAGIALFIIGCMGAAGTFPGSSIGWVTVALAGGGFALNLTLGNFKQRKFELIISGLVAATFVTVGVLGGVGTLSTSQVGWAIIGTGLIGTPLNYLVGRLKRRQIQQQIANLTD